MIPNMFVLKIFHVLVMVFICGVKGEVHDKSEGSPCEGMDGMKGTCIRARRCESFEYDRMNNIYPPICSFEGKEPVICCTDCKILDEDVKDVLDRDYYRTDRKYEKKCFKYQYLLPYSCKAHAIFKLRRNFNVTRQCFDLVIEAVAPVGGQDALRGDFPHMALVGYGPDLESAQWLCGGSLISERFILTAGHCSSSTQLGAATYVALGMLKRSDPPKYWKRYKIKRFIPHPDYHPPNKYNDIALIETEDKICFINFTEGVRPACLTHKPEFRNNRIAFATGWGALGKNRNNADIMQKVTLEKFTDEECAKLYPRHRHLPQGYNHTTQVCYGDHKKVRDTCKGDSGGPLQKRDPDARYCQYAIIGVTSYGLECGQPGTAGIYTRVHHYVPWIESIVWP